MNLSESRLESLLEMQGFKLKFLEQIDSTNTWLLNQSPINKPHLVVTSHQTAGRGRRGRTWLSRPEQSLCFSLRLPLALSINELNGFSLATALVIKEVLEPQLTQNLELKWPNDLLVGSKKLGGILIETASKSTDVLDLVIGIGINLETQEVTDKETIGLYDLNWQHDDINDLLVQLCFGLLTMSLRFQKHGFAGFVDAWHAQDCWLGRTVVVESLKQSISGTYEGVDTDGKLLLRQGEIINAYIAGELSLKNQDTKTL